MHMRTVRREYSFRWRISVVIAAFSCAVTVPLKGAIISWGAATSITADSNVLNTGFTAYAYCFSVNSPTVNGVSFTAATTATSSSNVIAPGFFYQDYTDFTSTSAPFSALSTNYINMLVGSLYLDTGNPTSVLVTLANLSSGHQYAVQLWVNDPRGPENSRRETVTSPGGNTVTLDFSTQTFNNPGGPGQYTVGTFTADAINQAFTMAGFTPTQYVTQLNALQVRDLGLPILPAWVAINPAGAGAMNLIFKGPAGSSYTLLTATNLAIPMTNWTQLPNGTGTFGSNNTTNLDSAATTKVKFYRIRSP